MSRQLIKGNEAIVKGAILAGCRAFYGYPITPASEIAEAAAYYLPQVGGTFLQAESEVAAINMVYGASSAGVPLTTVDGAGHTTNLPDACCDAVIMRMVMHHIRDGGVFARDLRRSLRAGGRLAVIDFAPGALPHLAGDHGIDPAQVIGIFTAAGFTVSSTVDDWGGRNFLIVFRAP